MNLAFYSFTRGILDGLGALARWAAVALIWGYRLLVRPLFPTTCRFEPSCSEYALQAVRRFGPLYGGWLALRRLGRCNPWGPFGSDLVPEHRHDHHHHHHAHQAR